MTHYHTIPHLTASMIAPMQQLEQSILEKQSVIEAWFESQWQLSPAPVYGSVDLRNAGFKLAPVDMNLFPAGFNNLNPEFLSSASEAAKIAIQSLTPSAKKMLIIPENHTRNLRYWENMQTLLAILIQAGFEAKIGTLLPDFTAGSDITFENGKKVHIESVVRQDNKIQLKNFIPDVLLLNNDLSEDIPEILKNLDQPLIPPAELGWNQRLKSAHFQHYANVCEEFASLLGIDSWVITPLFLYCGEVDFKQQEGQECLSSQVETLLKAIQKKYDQYHIKEKPYVVIKADAGTYGMAVMMVKDAKEVLSLNRKQRVSMSKSKGGQPVNRVIIQEGVYTFETWGEANAVAEPVVYMFGQQVIGGFYRVHKDRGVDENLNSPGMHFEPLAFVKSCNQPCSINHSEEQNLFYTYGVIARLSMLAAAREMLAYRKSYDN